MSEEAKPVLKKIRCLFRYANGRQCPGHVESAQACGPVHRIDGSLDRDEVKKYRLWCDEKGDHVGAVRSYYNQIDRMAYYPNELPAGVEDALWANGMVW